MTGQICPRCETMVGDGAQFCSKCGWDQNRVPLSKAISKLNAKTVSAFIAVAVVVFFSANALRWSIHWKRGDKRPTQAFQSDLPKSDVGGEGHAGLERASFEDPELDKLRAEVEKSPDDIKKLKALALRFGDLIRANPDAPPTAVFEAIDVFSAILKKEPNDPDALVLMADVSFDQKAFPKALQFYERYLKLQPKDLGARARYASTLTFLERYDDAIAELQSVLKSDSKNFPATAYLAITYAQKGDKAEALKTAKAALALAPSKEARSRFAGFVDALSNENGEQTKSDQPKSDSAVRMGDMPNDGQQSPAQALDAIVRGNPIAGPKFVKVELAEAGLAKLYFADFPMSQMPPFAKDKFMSGLKTKMAAAGLTSIKQLKFYDVTSGEEMDSLQVTE